MKKIAGLFVVAGVLGAVQAFGFGLPSIGGGSTGGGAQVDVKGLTSRETMIRIHVNKATVTLANGLIEVQKACGKAAEAAKLEATLAEAKKNPSDIETTKQLCAEVNNASNELKKVDLNASMDKGEARKRLGKSLLYLGSGSLVDMQAANDAKALVGDITNGINSVKAAPMSYGLSAAKDLASGLSTAKFVSGAIPGQLGTIAEMTKGLVKYAQTNKIDLPSDKEKEEMAKGMGKE